MTKKILRWTGFVLGGLVALVLVCAAGVYALTAYRFARTYPTRAEALTIPTDSASISRGRHLATAVSGCGGCHGADLGGNVMFDFPPVARLVALNLTRGAGGVGGQLSDADWERAIRHGIAPDGRALKFMPSQRFNSMSDGDLSALIAYLKQVPSVDRTPLKTTVGPLGRLLYLTGEVELIPTELIDQDAAHQPAPAAQVSPEYGKYLVAISGCTECHGPNLSGGHIPGTPSNFPRAANITPAGIGHYTETDFIRALREGKRPGGAPIDTMMPYKEYRGMTDDELRTLYTYLKTVSPREYGNR
jgi:cytochrome c553